MTTFTNCLTLGPAQLFIIANQQATEQITTYLQSLLCQHRGCTTCITCTLLIQKQSPYVCWLAPETRYTLDTFEVLFKKISFTLEHNTHFFFVIEQAHLLSSACANALLKLVEEPPTGYHFIFTASSLQAVIPTLRSRCQITIHSSPAVSPALHLLTYFTQPTNPNIFIKTLTTTSISEIEALLLLETLINHYTQILTQSPNIISIHTVLTYLQRQHAQGIMAGSTKIFLKDLYLTLNSLRKTS